MDGIHDLGGMQGFGPIPREAEEVPFHADWERRVFALLLALGYTGLFNIDEIRHAIERVPPAEYLSAGYYGRWARAIETLLIEKGAVSRSEFEARLGTRGRAAR
jgi:nitrile hydratase